MITNLILTFVATMVLYLAYKLLFRNSNRFQLNRIILLTISIFAFALPFIKISLKGQQFQEMPSFKQEMDVIFYNDAIIQENPVVEKTLSFTDIITYIYIIGVVFFLMKFVYNIFKIYKIKAGKKIETIDDVNFIYTNESHIPFSFFNNVFIGTSTSSETDNEVPEPVEGNANILIIKHEMSHVKNHHSVDVILMEIMIAFQWFNPFIRMIKNELKSNHEFIADSEAIKDEYEKSNYMMLLLQQCTADDFSTIANNFSFLLTKKRITMITKNQKVKGSVIKVLLTLPVFALLILLNTQCDNTKPNEEKQQTTVTETETILEQPVYDTEAATLQDSIYRVSEVMPQYPGGPNEMMRYIQENIKYPQSAKDNKIEGRVYVSFVVEKDGSITNAAVIRGIDKECDAEALRVVSSMPKWNPGQQDGKNVRTQFTIPIIYKFN